MGILTAFATGFVDAANQARNEKEQAEYDAMINARDQKQKESFYKFTSDMEAKVDKERATELAAANIALVGAEAGFRATSATNLAGVQATAASERAEVEASQNYAAHLNQVKIIETENIRLKGIEDARRAREKAAIRTALGAGYSEKILNYLSENLPYTEVMNRLTGPNPDTISEDLVWTTWESVQEQNRVNYIASRNPGGVDVQSVWDNSEYVKKWNAWRKLNPDADPMAFEDVFRSNPVMEDDVVVGYEAVNNDEEFWDTKWSVADATKLEEMLFPMVAQSIDIPFWANGEFVSGLLSNGQTDRLMRLKQNIINEFRTMNPVGRPEVDDIAFEMGTVAARKMEFYSTENGAFIYDTLSKLRNGDTLEDIQIIETLELYGDREALDNKDIIEEQENILLMLLDPDQRQRVLDEIAKPPEATGVDVPVIVPVGAATLRKPLSSMNAERADLILLQEQWTEILDPDHINSQYEFITTSSKQPGIPRPLEEQAITDRQEAFRVQVENYRIQSADVDAQIEALNAKIEAAQQPVE